MTSLPIERVWGLFSWGESDSFGKCPRTSGNMNMGGTEHQKVSKYIIGDLQVTH